MIILVLHKKNMYLYISMCITHKYFLKFVFFRENSKFTVSSNNIDNSLLWKYPINGEKKINVERNFKNMSSHLSVLIDQIILFATLIAIGYLSEKTKLLTNDMIEAMSGIVVKLMIPAMILTVIANGGTREGLMGLFPVFVCSLVMIAFLLFLGDSTGRLLKLKQPTKNIHTSMVGFSNSGFLGFPILISMFPEKGPLFVAIYIIADALTLWTIGPILTNPESSGKKIDLKKLISPSTMAAVIGVLMVLLNIRPKNIPWEAVTEIGNMCKYLAMIYIGADMARKGFKEIFKRPVIFSVIPIKLIIAPIIVFCVLNFLNILDSEYVIMLTVIAMLPSMVAVVMLAKSFGSDDEYASGALLSTTLASIFTMPLVMWIVETVI